MTQFSVLMLSIFLELTEMNAKILVRCEVRYVVLFTRVLDPLLQPKHLSLSRLFSFFFLVFRVTSKVVMKRIFYPGPVLLSFYCLTNCGPTKSNEKIFLTPVLEVVMRLTCNFRLDTPFTPTIE